MTDTDLSFILLRMASINSHRDLLVWQKAMDMTVLIYQLSAKSPSNENYRLVAQMTRSASSVAANTAEGHARATKRDYSHFLAVAKGSLMETETFVMLSVRARLYNPSGGTESSRSHYRNQQDADRPAITVVGKSP